MRVTSPEAVTVVWKYLKANVPATVTANIFKYERPLNHTGECIVINSLPLTASQHQEGIVNVNYFVPNVRNTSVTPIDDTQPNSYRLETGAKKIDALFTGVYTSGMFLETQQTTLMSNDNLKEWYCNIRVSFKNINI